MYWPEELLRKIVSKLGHRSCGRDVKIDRLILQYGGMKPKAFWGILTNKDAGKSIAALRDETDIEILKTCLRQAVKHHKITVVSTLWQYVCLSQSEEQEILSRILKRSTNISSLKEIIGAIRSEPSQLGYCVVKASSKSETIAMKDLLTVLSSRGAKYNMLPLKVVQDIIDKGDMESFLLIRSTIDGHRFRYERLFIDIHRIDIEFFMKLIDSSLIHVIPGHVIESCIEYGDRFADKKTELYGCLLNPHRFFMKHMETKRYDIAKESLVHNPRLVWATAELHWKKGEWPDELLDLYLKRVVTKVVELRTFYTPSFRPAAANQYRYVDPDKPNRDSHRLVMACLRNGIRIDATPDMSLSWACQTGDMAAVTAYLDKVIMPVDLNQNVYLLLAMSWRRDDIVKLLKTELGLHSVEEHT